MSEQQEENVIEIDVSMIFRPKWQRVFYVPSVFKQHYAIIRKNTSVSRLYAAYVAIKLALLILK